MTLAHRSLALAALGALAWLAHAAFVADGPGVRAAPATAPAEVQGAPAPRDTAARPVEPEASARRPLATTVEGAPPPIAPSPATSPPAGNATFDERYAASSAGDLAARQRELTQAWDAALQELARARLDAGAYVEVEGCAMPELELAELWRKSMIAFPGTRADGTACTRWVLVPLDALPDDVAALERERAYLDRRLRELSRVPSEGASESR
ncbi:MAG: hypothetical protein H6828_05800 [Planctomycetes bacterium]|nr:hypothetical protein [Planctomycetota bacterium]